MKILVIADVESKALWDYYEPERLKGVDLIISCGDLKPSYLEFLVTMTNLPLLYVRGNHDGRYAQTPPEGCICIEDRVYNYKGLRILGLGGSYRYIPDRPDMFTEKEMTQRIGKMKPELFLKNGFDILVSHAPAAGHGDLEDLPHRGFECFNRLLEHYHPRYMLHGHVHMNYAADVPRIMEHSSGTKIINAYERYIFDIAEEEYRPLGQTGSPLYDLHMNFRKGRLKDG
jgi:Icc-related predicted phosphoesterase